MLQYSLTQGVQPCAETLSSLETARAITIVFVRAKAERLKTWTWKNHFKREKFVCAQSEYKYPRLDRNDHAQNTLENPLLLMLLNLNLNMLYDVRMAVTILILMLLFIVSSLFSLMIFKTTPP